MSIQVRYFASLREALGTGETVDAVPGETVGALRDRLAAGSASHAQALSRSKALRCALNLALCAESLLVPDGSEVAFFPPVTGG
jgi:molybdopterin synthase sulfur carrier subunit